MTKLRGYIPTMTFMLVMMFGATAANAGDGIIIGERTQQSSRDGIIIGERTKADKSLGGIIIGELTKAATFLTTGIIIGE